MDLPLGLGGLAGGEEREDEDVMVLDAWNGDDSDDDGESYYSSDHEEYEEDDASLVDGSTDAESEDFEMLYAETTSSSAGSDNEQDESASAELPLLLNDSSVVQHGIGTSLRHHQCCDAVAPVDFDADKIIYVHGRHAILYDIPTKRLVASVLMGFEPYSIAQNGPLFAAGGHNEIALFQICEEGHGRVNFKSLAVLQVVSPPYLAAMNNGLRFGRCGSKVRLLVANQDRYIYAFTVPPQSVHRSSQDPGSCSSREDAHCSGAASSSQARSWPPLFQGGDVQPTDFLCTSLRAGCPSGQSEGCLRPIMIRSGREWRMDASYLTDAIGPFNEPLNCAAPSPNGAWIAVVGDGRDVDILEFDQGYSITSRVTFPFLHSRSGKRRPYSGVNTREGCQYAVWNSSSTMLAVSSDAHHMVRVWSVKRGQDNSPRMCTRQTPSLPAVAVQLVASVGGRGRVPRPCLALQFDPVDEKLLYYVERAGRLHAVDIRGLVHLAGKTRAGKLPGEGGAEAPQCEQVVSVRPRLQQDCIQSLRGCMAGHDSAATCSSANCIQYSMWGNLGERKWPNSGKLTGLVASAKHGVLVACRDRLLQYQVRREWSQESHRHFPASFKSMVSFLVLVSNSPPKSGASLPSAGPLPSGFWSLPREILHKIIAEAAMPVSAWSILRRAA